MNLRTPSAVISRHLKILGSFCWTKYIYTVKIMLECLFEDFRPIDYLQLCLVIMFWYLQLSLIQYSDLWQRKLFLTWCHFWFENRPSSLQNVTVDLMNFILCSQRFQVFIFQTFWFYSARYPWSGSNSYSLGNGFLERYKAPKDVQIVYRAYFKSLPPGSVPTRCQNVRIVLEIIPRDKGGWVRHLIHDSAKGSRGWRLSRAVVPAEEESVGVQS